MTELEKRERIEYVKRQLKYAKGVVQLYIERPKGHGRGINYWIGECHRLHIKLNQLRIKYWIFR